MVVDATRSVEGRVEDIPIAGISIKPGSVDTTIVSDPLLTTGTAGRIAARGILVTLVFNHHA
jgi:hypothetical protein